MIHVAITHDGTYQKIYANGVLNAVSEQRPSGIVDGGDNLRFGRVENTRGGWFSGLMDDIWLFEEPNTPSPKLTRLIAEKINIPIASGERIYTRWGYAPYFENGSLALIQPDLGTSGGITECKKICDMAYVYDVSVQIHVCSSPILVAAALQLEAVIPNFCIHEHHVINRASYNRELCVHDYQPVDGFMSVPEIPGIGNELSEYALKTAIWNFSPQP